MKVSRNSEPNFSIAYTLIPRRRKTLLQSAELWGRLDETLVQHTTVTGYKAQINKEDFPCSITPDGVVSAYQNFHWDFGSGPAINTPQMVWASVVHDVICRMTNEGRIPWSAREKGDKFFRLQLKQAGVHPLRRWWCYTAVKYNSMLSYWTRKRN